MLPKPTTPRDKRYLEWVKRQPCISCESSFFEVHPHHTTTGGMGIKGSDYETIPLCTFCHREWHDHKGKGGGWDRERLQAACEGLRERYLGRGK